ncbi:hypothetical protein HK101_004655 [Irineochytrium annulatum]|nr:hypothetical protein HK101_004655 [Irineochytrium annulatum]
MTPTADPTARPFVVRILGLRLRGRLQPQAPVAASTSDVDVVAVDSIDEAAQPEPETKASLVLIRNSWADLSLPVTFKFQDAEEVVAVRAKPEVDPIRAKEERDAWILFGWRALWVLGAVGVIVGAIIAIIVTAKHGPWLRMWPGDFRCDGVCTITTRAWWSKDVDVSDRSGPHDVYLFDKMPSATVAAPFSTNLTLSRQSYTWNTYRRMNLMQRAGDKFTFDVIVTAASQVAVSVTMRSRDSGMQLFRHTLASSGRIEARVPDFDPSVGAFGVILEFNLDTHYVSFKCSGDTSQYDVSTAIASCPAQTRSPFKIPCHFPAPSAFHKAYLLLQESGVVGTAPSNMFIYQGPRIIAFVLIYIPQSLAILAALGLISYVAYHRKTPVEVWREKKTKHEAGTDEEREPMLGEDV